MNPVELSADKTKDLPNEISLVLKWQVVLDLRRALVHGWSRIGRCCWLRRRLTRRLSTSISIVRAAQKCHIVDHDFGRISCVVAVIFPASGPQSSFEIDLVSFAQILLSQANQSRPPNGDVVPFGLLLTLSISVFVAFCCGQ